MPVNLSKPARAVGSDHTLTYAGPIVRMNANVVVIRPNACTGRLTGTIYPAHDLGNVILDRAECDLYDWS